MTSEPTPPASEPAATAEPAPPVAASTSDIIAVWAIVVILVLPSIVSGLQFVLYEVIDYDYLSCLRYVVSGLSDMAIVAVLAWKSGMVWADLGIRRPCMTDLVLALLIGWIWYLLPEFIDGVLGGRLSDRPYVPASMQPGRGWLGWLLFALATVMAAAGEELIFRALLIPRLIRMLNSRGFAVVVSSTLFAVCHLYQGKVAVIIHFACSMVLGWLYVYVPRVLPFALGHALCNILITAMPVRFLTDSPSPFDTQQTAW